MKPLKTSLEIFSEGDVCLLSDSEQKTFCFVWGVCNATIYVDFANIVNQGALQWIREKGSVSSEIAKVNELQKTREKLEEECQKESARLLLLRDQTRVAGQKLISKKKKILLV